jgi:hypothetical protein
VPTVLQWKGHRFFFYSNEGNPREPVHIHVRRGDATARLWLNPPHVADSYGFSASDLRQLLAVVDEHKQFIERAWHEHFG